MLLTNPCCFIVLSIINGSKLTENCVCFDKLIMNVVTLLMSNTRGQNIQTQTSQKYLRLLMNFTKTFPDISDKPIIMDVKHLY